MTPDRGPNPNPPPPDPLFSVFAKSRKQGSIGIMQFSSRIIAAPTSRAARIIRQKELEANGHDHILIWTSDQMEPTR